MAELLVHMVRIFHLPLYRKVICLSCLTGYYTLQKQQPFNGTLSGEDAWVYFSYQPSSKDNTLVVQLTTVEHTVQLYAKLSLGSPISWPRTDYYDYKDPVDGPQETLSIIQPQPGTGLLLFYSH
jgi:hypothetical protein